MLALHEILRSDVLVKTLQELVWLILDLLLYMLHDIKLLIIIRCLLFDRTLLYIQRIPLFLFLRSPTVFEIDIFLAVKISPEKLWFQALKFLIISNQPLLDLFDGISIDHPHVFVFDLLQDLRVSLLLNILIHSLLVEGPL